MLSARQPSEVHEKATSRDPTKLLRKHPDHIPVICHQPHPNKPQKLLVPKNMERHEFIDVVRKRCKAASPESEVTLLKGNPLPNAENMGVIYKLWKSSDDLLYVAVHSRKAEEERRRSIEDIFPTWQPDPEHASKAPRTFHMPDNDQAQSNLDDAVRRSRRLLKKYPDRVPVLVKQGRTTGLPDIDKKLLVPRTMRCDELQKILPKQIGIEPLGLKWQNLRLYMGDILLQESFLLSEVYSQYVDDTDGGLHITLRMDAPIEKTRSEQDCPQAAWSKPVDYAGGTFWDGIREVLGREVNEKDVIRTCRGRVISMSEMADVAGEELQNLFPITVNVQDDEEHDGENDAHDKAQMQSEIATLKEQLEKAWERIDAAENRANDAEAMRLAESEQALNAELQVDQYRESHATEVAKVRQLEQEIKQAAEHERELVELLASKDMEREQLKAEVSALKEQLAVQKLSCANDEAWTAKLQKVEERAEKAEMAKEAALSEAKLAVDRVAKLEGIMQTMSHDVEVMSQKFALESAEKTKFEKEAADLAEQLERARDGYIHINCNRYGFVTDAEAEENEFEVLQP